MTSGARRAAAIAALVASGAIAVLVGRVGEEGPPSGGAVPPRPPSASPGADARAREADAADADGAIPAAWGDTGRVIVEVLNASRVRGLARQAAAVLRDHGLDVVLTANAPDTTVRDTTLVLLRGRRADRADRVLRALGEGRVEARPDPSRDVDVTVLLGRRWRPPAEPFHP